ncbi:MAG: type V CRISPR-associated protein Cpf1, partial [Treponema sp.]|nr:type V CRISPR-associated protein Cpf1 [Treponema sp.]
MKINSNFAGQENGYSRSITLRNALIPQGKTEENVQKFLERDKERADAYPEVKKVIDKLHKSIIEDVLKSIDTDWQPLADALTEYQKTKDAKAKKELENQQIKMMKVITQLFSTDDRFKKVFGKELFSELLPALIQSDEEVKEKEALINQFNKFSTYFTGFHENRRNIYNWESGPTSVSYRIVHDNFPKFMANIKLYEELKKNHNQVLVDTENSLKEFLNGIKLDNIFCVNGFNKVLNQSGINFYNTIIGGISKEAGTEKIQGLNEHINLYRQHLPQEAQKSFRGKMVVLYKQILSDREKVSFIPEG